MAYIEYIDYIEMRVGLLEKRNRYLEDCIQGLEQENNDLKAAAKARDYETTTLITSLKDELNKFPPPIEDCDEEV